MAPIKPESAADRLTFQEQLVGRFVQMSLGALSIWQMSNQLSGKLVDVDAFEVVELLSLEIEDSRTKDDRYVDATAVEYFPSTASLRSGRSLSGLISYCGGVC